MSLFNNHTNSRTRRRDERAVRHLSNRLRADIGLNPRANNSESANFPSVVWPPYSGSLDR
ncbi:MAG: hypothetical protein OD811_04035 [Alphaproteobacteria bacterium]